MGSRILVTGAAGFLASHLSALLVARGDEVVGIDNFDPYYPAARKWANVAAVRAGLGGERFTLVQADVRDRDRLQRTLQSGFDAVAHLAALAGVTPSVKRPDDYVDVNIGSTLSILEAAWRTGTRSVVFVSTSSVYGNATPPFVETHRADEPLAPYAATKRAAEMLCHTYHHVHGLSCTVLRLFTAYGPRNRPDMMAYKVLDSIFTGREIPLFGGGEMLRDWTYVGDIARGIAAALDRPLGYEIINIGGGQPVKLRNFITAVEEIAGRSANLLDAPRVDTDALATAADIAKARRLLGFQPRISLEQGVRRLVRWYLDEIRSRRPEEEHGGLGQREERLEAV